MRARTHLFHELSNALIFLLYSWRQQSAAPNYTPALVSDGAERGAFSLIALDPLSAAPRLTIGMEEFTVYDYHPLRWIAPLISVLREPVRNKR